MIPIRSFKRKKVRTLRHSLLLMFTIHALITLALIGTISYSAIYTILQNKIEKGIEENLIQIDEELENVIFNLNYTSQQIAYDTDIRGSLDQYVEASGGPFELYELNSEILKTLNLVNYTNPSVGLMFYYFPADRKVPFSNLKVKEPIDLSSLPVLTSRKGVTFYGPHASLYRDGGDQTVFSVVRELKLNNNETCLVYVELNGKLFRGLWDRKQSGLSSRYAMLNDSGEVMYSELPEMLPAGTSLPIGKPEFSRIQKHAGNYLYAGVQGEKWRILSAVPVDSYNKEMNEWQQRFALIAVISLFVSLMFGLIIWRKVYHPITIFNKVFKLTGENHQEASLEPFRVAEFDMMMDRFVDMRAKIRELFLEIEHKERFKRQLEVDKLIAQINPHFLYNTLNTIQWLAKMNGQTDIVRFVAIFTRLLQYNLGKLGNVVSLGEEISALKDYVDLQRIRYDYDFDVRMEVDELALNVQVPRFLLQPLIENALYHGLRDDGGMITLIVTMPKSDTLAIRVSDNGAGMSPEEISRLTEDQPSEGPRVGLGIGLQYIKRMIQVYYGEQARFYIESEPGVGTEIGLVIPMLSKEVRADESDDRGR